MRMTTPNPGPTAGRSRGVRSHTASSDQWPLYSRVQAAEVPTVRPPPSAPLESSAETARPRLTQTKAASSGTCPIAMTVALLRRTTQLWAHRQALTPKLPSARRTARGRQQRASPAHRAPRIPAAGSTPIPTVPHGPPVPATAAPPHNPPARRVLHPGRDPDNSPLLSRGGLAAHG